MTERWRAPRGWTVKVVRLSGAEDNTDSERLRVCQYGFFTADVRTVAELERFFSLADLEPELAHGSVVSWLLPTGLYMHMAIFNAVQQPCQPAVKGRL
jgi:hypothetical protein